MKLFEMSKSIVIATIIIVGSFIVASGLIFFNFNPNGYVAAGNTRWVQEIGSGIAIPACSSSSASVTCSSGSPSVTISWSYGNQHGGCNWTNIGILPGPSWPGQFCSGSLTWNGASNNTNYSYYVDFTGGGLVIDSTGGSFSTPNCNPSPPTASISANPPTIKYGQSAVISWSSTNATSCSIDQGIGGVSTSGSKSVSPIATTAYNLTCIGSGGSASASTTVNVIPGDFTLSLGGPAVCNSVPLSWMASGGAAAYRILKGNPRVDISPYQPYTSLNFTDNSVSQNTTYQYQIEAYNGGSTNRSNSVSVTTPYCPPTINFSGNPTSIYNGQSTTLTWSSTYATSCAASGAWSGSKAVSGSQVVIPSPPPSATYTLVCTGPGGSSGPQSVTINISPLALPNWQEIIPR